MIRSYVVVTPARDEAENLPRLAAALAAQTIPPTDLDDRRQRVHRRDARARTLARRGVRLDRRALGSGVFGGRSRRPGRAGAAGRNRRSRRATGGTGQRRRGHLVRPRLLRAPAGQVRRGSIAGDRERQRLRAARRRRGNSGSSPAARSGAPRAHIAGSAYSSCCRSRSAWPGTASTSSRRTPAVGARRPSRAFPSGTIAARASGTAPSGGRFGTRGARPTSSATAPGTSSCARSGTPAASRRRSR